VRQVSVKRFVFDERSVAVEGTLGESQRVRYPELRLVMRGRRIATQVETKQEVETHHTGGKGYRVHRMFEEKRDQVENFLWVLGQGVRWAFTQSTLCACGWRCPSPPFWRGCLCSRRRCCATC
jgi:hypothetical protein